LTIKVESLLKLSNNKTMKELKEIRECEETNALYKNHAEKELTINDLDRIKRELKLVKSKTMEFSYMSRLMKIACKRCVRNPETKSKMKMYKKVISYVAEKLDIVHYINQLENLDRVILLLLNTEQKTTFDFIKRPNLADKGEMACFEIDFKRNKSRDALDVINYYIRKARAGDLDDKDREIFPLINPSIKKFMFREKELEYNKL
jgi:hypothetical protein